MNRSWWRPTLWRDIFRRSRLQQDLEEEIRAHVQLETERRIGEGEDPQVARTNALRSIRSLRYVKEATREVWALARVEGWAQDLGYGARTLVKTPAFSAVAVLTAALGIGASTLIFTVFNSVLLKPLPFVEPDRIVQLWEVGEDGGRMAVPELNFLDWKSDARSFDELAIYAVGETTVLGGSEPVRTSTAVVTGEFFDVFQVRPQLGPGFQPADFAATAPPVAVVSHGFWTRVLGSPQDLDGVTLTFSNNVHQVVGVLPAGFAFPLGTEIWTNRPAGRDPGTSRSSHNWRSVGRLAPGVTVAGATSEIDAIAARIHEEYADVTAVGAVVVELQGQLAGPVRTPLLVLMAAVTTLLLIACVNLANLLLARTESRRSELAVRAALGGSRFRIGRQILVESLLLAAMGGALGVGFAIWSVEPVLAWMGAELPATADLTPDMRVLLFAVGLTLASALLVGSLPALRLSRTDLSHAMNDGGRGQAGSGASRLRSGLVVAQVAMTLVLLIGGTLLSRSFLRILAVDLGFETSNRLVVDTIQAYPENEEMALRMGDFHRAAEADIASLPGVASVGGINAAPLAGSFGGGRFGIEGGGHSGDYWPAYRVVSPGYFGALGIPLVEGRPLDDTDVWGRPGVVLISQRVADAVWPGQNAIGRRINFGNMDGLDEFVTIVGVVRDAHYSGPGAPYRGEVYFSYHQRPQSAARFHWIIQAEGNPTALGPAVRDRIQALDPALPVNIRTMDGMLSSVLSGRVFNLSLVAAFAVVALLLTTIGIYALVAYMVSQRVPEIGIRTALGARSSQIIWLFIRRSAFLVALGIGVGLASSTGATRVLAGLLFEVPPVDPLSYATGIVALVVPALLAGLLSSRRASRIDPLVALRNH